MQTLAAEWGLSLHLASLADLDPDVVLPMHCTGRDFIETMRHRMPDKLVGANLGSRYTFGV